NCSRRGRYGAGRVDGSNASAGAGSAVSRRDRVKSTTLVAVTAGATPEGSRRTITSLRSATASPTAFGSVRCGLPLLTCPPDIGPRPQAYIGTGRDNSSHASQAAGGNWRGKSLPATLGRPPT